MAIKSSGFNNENQTLALANECHLVQQWNRPLAIANEGQMELTMRVTAGNSHNDQLV